MGGAQSQPVSLSESEAAVAVAVVAQSDDESSTTPAITAIMPVPAPTVTTRTPRHRSVRARTNVDKKVAAVKRQSRQKKHAPAPVPEGPKWIGEPTKRKMGKDVVLMYKAYELDDEQFNAGDCVFLRNALPNMPPNIGRIVSLFEREEDELMLAEILWYYHPDELPKTPSVKAAKFDESELVVYGTNRDDNDLRAIDGKAYVVPAWEWTQNMEESDEHFVVRRCYDHGKKTLRDITREEWAETAKATGVSKASLKRVARPSKRRKVEAESSDEDDDEAQDKGYIPREDESEEEEEEDADEEEEESESSEAEEDDSEGEGRRKKRKTPSKRKRETQPASSRAKAKPQRAKTTPATTGRRRSTAVRNIQRSAAECRSVPTGMYEQARSKLHVSAVPDSLPCREDEFADVYSFVESKIEGGNSGAMYISGVPGTGKTATVHEVMRQMEKNSEDGELPSFKFIEVNGMKLSDPMQVYTHIWQALTGDRLTPKHALELLHRFFNTPSPRRECIVLLVDELDQLTAKNNIIYELLNWPLSPHARLVVLTIANTMDLPERMMSHKVSSRMGLRRLTFEPYTHMQLMEIVTSRLANLPVFKPEAIQLCARKIAASAGDARRCLDICRAATELAEAQGEGTMVGIPEIDAVIKRMLNTSTVQSVTTGSLHERLWLMAVLLEFRVSGMEETSFGKVAERHAFLCQHQAVNLPPPPRPLQASVCARLANSKLLLADAPAAGLYQRLRLNLDIKQVELALRNDTAMPKLL